MLKPKKAKPVLEDLKMANNGKEEESTKWSIKVKISTTLYSIVSQNEKISKTAVTFLFYDNMFVNSYYINLVTF